MKNTRLYFFAYVKRLPTLNSFAFHGSVASWLKLVVLLIVVDWVFHQKGDTN